MKRKNFIKKVAISGGTHGNELTGVYLVKKWQKNPSLVKRDSFETVTELMNERAIKEVRRYIDHDLNRSFRLEDLKNDSLNSYEAKLAKKIDKLLGKKGSKNPNVDFIVDLHTTTSNMGLSIVVSNDSITTWRAISYLCGVEPKLKVYRWRGDIENGFVDSIAPNGFAIEVGAIPQGVLRADLFLETEKLVYHLLDFIEKENRNENFELLDEVEIYDHVELIDYPRNHKGEIIGMVHQERQDKDYKPIRDGDPLFLTLENETICYKGETLYTLFVNESAYYEKGFAMTLAKKVSFKIKENISLEEFLNMVDVIEKNLPKESPINELKNSYKRNPYTVLMVTLLSLRSRDEQTAMVARKLFNKIQTPQELLQLSQKELEENIKSIGFYKKKARTLLEVSKVLIEKYDSTVPNNKIELLSIKGVGEKTANVVLNSVFNFPIIAVDTHVHRLCNMWGVVDTKNENETSKILNEIVPLEYKSKLNHILVGFGQTICKVNNPKCDICPVDGICNVKNYKNNNLNELAVLWDFI